MTSGPKTGSAMPTHDKSLEDLVAGRADIAALAETPWQNLQINDPERAETLRLVWRSGPLPPGPVICRDRRCPSIAGSAILQGAFDRTVQYYGSDVSRPSNLGHLRRGVDRTGLSFALS